MKKNLKVRLMALLLCVVMLMSVACTSTVPEAEEPADDGAEEEIFPANGAKKILARN